MWNEIKEEKNIEADFFRMLAKANAEDDFIKVAQLAPEIAPAVRDQGSSIGGDLGGDGDSLEAELDPSEPDGGEGGLPTIDTDTAEMEAVKELIPWDSFVILFDPHYAKLLQDSLQLPEPKAKSKSFYIYFSPENKRLEGIINKRYLGGYGQKEQLGEDFTFLKSLSPEGFPGDWKEKLLNDIDELPAVENSKVKDELRRKQEQKEEAEEEGGVEEPKLEAPAEKTPAPAPAAPKVPPPPSVGKVETKGLASVNEIRMKRFARNLKMKKIANDLSEENEAFLEDTKKNPSKYNNKNVDWSRFNKYMSDLEDQGHDLNPLNK